MSIIRSERVAAAILLVAASAGLLVANTPIGPTVLALQDTHLAIPGTPLDLSIGHWISDGLLAIFFFVVAIELKHEIAVGQLNSFSKAIRPAIAALGGVLVPALVFIAFTAGSGYEGGWPIPTATDIAFALGVLAVFGKGIPTRFRIFILALAILDDIVAIVIIAVFFTADPNLLYIALAAVGVAGFGILSRLVTGRERAGRDRADRDRADRDRTDRHRADRDRADRHRAVGDRANRYRAIVIVAMVAIALVTWSLVYLSGIHATIAGVALGLAMARVPAAKTRHALEPATNGIVLPIFAFSAALVAIPQVAITDLAAPFWGILIALPVGKIIGISLGGWLSGFVGHGNRLDARSLITMGALGGIGFTVSLLMNELAFADHPEVADEGTLAVLLGSTISIVIAAVLVSRLAARHRVTALLR